MVQYFPEITGSLTINGSLSVSGPMSITGSIAGTSSLASNAFTASSADAFNVRGALTGSSATFTGTITAQTLSVQQVTSSIVYSCGSNNFGTAITNRQVFTGSLYITGSSTQFTTDYVGINCTNIAGRTFVVKGYQGGTTIAEFISSNGCDSIYLAPSTAGINLISGNYVAGSTYKSLAISARENASDLVLSNTGIVTFGCQICTTQLAVRSALPRVEISSTDYAGLYKSFFGSLKSAEGILQFGNNGANYVLIGNTTAGGNLQFRTNINTDYGYGCGQEAFTIYCDTSTCFAGPVKLAGAYASCLGLGTNNSPAKYLHIQGTNDLSQGIRFSEAGGNYPHNIYFGSSGGDAAGWGLDFQVATASSTSATVLSLRGNCRVGINVTTPCSALHIVDASANATTLTIGQAGEIPTIKAGGTNTDLRIEAVGGGGFLEFATNSCIRFRTYSTGETCFNCQISAYSYSATANAIGIEYLLIAGGGGGGWDVGGGGGAGGVLQGSTGIYPGVYQVGIGAGGAGSFCNAASGIPAACKGYNSYAIGLVAIGGGGGGNYSAGSGTSGGSGGGGAGYGATTNAGFGMTNQGFSGGCGINVGGAASTGGGGGGAGGVGAQSANNMSGYAAGGAGILSTIIGEHRSYACGGRGGGDSWTGPMINGIANTGGGGDGAGQPNTGCSGGSGIFIIKMLVGNSATFSGGLTTTTCTNLGGYNIYVVTAGAGTMTIS